MSTRLSCQAQSESGERTNLVLANLKWGGKQKMMKDVNVGGRVEKRSRYLNF